MKNLILIICALIIACNPVGVIKESKHLNTLITVEYTSTIKQVTESRSFYVSTQYLKKAIQQFGWLQSYKSDNGYSGYCRSLTIKRDGDLIAVEFIGSPINSIKCKKFVWVEPITDEKFYRKAMSYYEPIEYCFFDIYLGD